MCLQANTNKEQAFPHPAASPFQPRGQTLADELPHAVDDGVHHRRVTVANAVHRQGSGHGVQGHHLPPRHAFRRRENKHLVYNTSDSFNCVYS